MLKLLKLSVILLMAVAARAQTKLDTSFSNDGILVHARYGATQFHPLQVYRILMMPDSNLLFGCDTKMNPNGPVGIYGYSFCRATKAGKILDTTVNQYSLYYTGMRMVMPPNNISADWNGTRDMMLLPGGKILYTGSVLYNNSSVPTATTFRINYPSLTLDSSYGTYGMGQLYQGAGQIAERTVLGPDGSSFTISNYLYSDSLFAFLIKRKPNGMLDSSWQQNGVFRYWNQKGGQFNDIKMDSVGNIYIAGMYKDNATLFHAIVLKLLPNGNVNTAYGTNGIAEGHYIANDLLLNPDGSTYVAGGGYFFNSTTMRGYVIKFKPNGQRDSGFATAGRYIYANNQFGFTDFLRQPDGKLLLIGNNLINNDSNWFAASRLLPTGVLDTSFGTQGIYDVHALLPPGNPSRFANCGMLQPDGKLLIGGSGFTPNSVEMLVVRLTNKIDTAGNTPTVPPTPGKVITAADNSFAFSVAPVPAHDQLILQYSIRKREQLTMALTDMSGRLVRSELLGNSAAGNYSQRIDIAGLPAGTYVLKMQGTVAQEARLVIVR